MEVFKYTATGDRLPIATTVQYNTVWSQQ